MQANTWCGHTCSTAVLMVLAAMPATTAAATTSTRLWMPLAQARRIAVTTAALGRCAHRSRIGRLPFSTLQGRITRRGGRQCLYRRFAPRWINHLALEPRTAMAVLCVRPAAWRPRLDIALRPTAFIVAVWAAVMVDGGELIEAPRRPSIEPHWQRALLWCLRRAEDL